MGSERDSGGAPQIYAGRGQGQPKALKVKRGFSIVCTGNAEMGRKWGGEPGPGAAGPGNGAESRDRERPGGRTGQGPGGMGGESRGGP